MYGCTSYTVSGDKGVHVREEQQCEEFKGEMFRRRDFRMYDPKRMSPLEQAPRQQNGRTALAGSANGEFQGEQLRLAMKRGLRAGSVTGTLMVLNACIFLPLSCDALSMSSRQIPPSRLSCQVSEVSHGIGL